MRYVLCDAKRKRICTLALRGDLMRYSICTFLRCKATSSKVQMKVKFNNENLSFCMHNHISFLFHFLSILLILIYLVIISLKLILLSIYEFYSDIG